jgi:hypothetical protein
MQKRLFYKAMRVCANKGSRASYHRTLQRTLGSEPFRYGGHETELCLELSRWLSPGRIQATSLAVRELGNVVEHEAGGASPLGANAASDACRLHLVLSALTLLALPAR